MLALKRSEKILDIGCGQGTLCREMAKAGADVTGIDSSRKLIEIAKNRAHGKETLHFFVSDASDMRGVNNEIFDAVTCVLAIGNMEHLEKVANEASRVLKRTGRFILVLNHPCFRIPRQSGWGFDDKRKLQYRRVDRYLSEMKIPIQMHPGAAPTVYTWTFHRPLSVYFNALASAGFIVDKLEEWASQRRSAPGKKSSAENLSREEIPMFLAISALKAPG
jgi:ubiquinone/menaquinone biosynthesis C-methylase UbiE